MTSEPFFSIIVVALNSQDCINMTIDSVLSQSYDDYEIIVKDGVSVDATVSCIPKNDKIKVFVEKDAGIYNAMNQAISYSSGEYLCFMNCGDVFDDKFVLEKIKNDTPTDNTAIVYGNYRRKGVVAEQPVSISPFYLYRTPLCHQTMFIGKAVFDKFDVYDDSYRILADYDHTLRCFRNGVTFVHSNCTVVDYMGGGISESQALRRKKHEEYIKARERYFSALEIKKFERVLKFSLSGLRQWLAKDTTPCFLRMLYRRIVNLINKF